MTRRAAPRVEIRRVYDHHPDDGMPRVLIDRLWPRGLAKADVPMDEWLKDVAPSTDLRRWYGHDPAKFEAFAQRYRAELATAKARDGVARLRARAGKSGVVLLTSTRDVEHSAAAVLLEMLMGPAA